MNSASTMNNLPNSLTDSFAQISFDPLIPLSWWLALAGLSFLFFFVSWAARHRNVWLRGVTVACFLILLSGPGLVVSERSPQANTVVVVTDQSGSQSIGVREAHAETIKSYLDQNLRRLKNLNIRSVNTDALEGESRTALFKTLEAAFQDIPNEERAGAVIITDGQIHDVPANKAAFSAYGPLHFFLTGSRTERDRQVQIIEAAPYGLMGERAVVQFMIKDNTTRPGDIVAVTIQSFQGNVKGNVKDNVKGSPATQTVMVPVNTVQKADVLIAQAGKNMFQISTTESAGEITVNNNRATFEINGIRDRLKVLLVSGQPYTGARVWRDLLTSDPAVDLVHFTILREPDKIDPTPSRELSLIAFPMEELFETKLRSFDLIILDRYDRIGILPDFYFENIRNYVEEGGALLVAHGPEFNEPDSIITTALRDILPAKPAGDLVEAAFIPQLTDQGRTHPVTRSLGGEDNADDETWGPWLRQVKLMVDAATGESEVLMTGNKTDPLLVLGRIKDGRVTQLASDQIWLWARGYEGGGPHAVLLRKIIHWLMKEPELDERAMIITQTGKEITVIRRNTHNKNESITVTGPDGVPQRLSLETAQSGQSMARYETEQRGVFRFEDETGHTQFFSNAPPASQETQAVLTTDAIIGPVAAATGGGVFWFEENPNPALQMTRPQQNYAGRNWLALRENGRFTTTSLKQIPLVPAWMGLLLLLCLLIWTWWREGRS